MTSRLPASTQTIFTAAALMAATSMATACQEYPLHDLGYTNGELSGSNDDPSDNFPVAEFGSEFGGVWIGEADDPFALRPNADRSPPRYRFPSGSRRIRLELVPAESGLFSSATITFGEGAPPPPATDPEVGYPVDPDFDITSLGATDRTQRPPIGAIKAFWSTMTASAFMAPTAFRRTAKSWPSARSASATARAMSAPARSTAAPG